MIASTERIVLTGAAGLVGQNLAVVLRELGWSTLVGIDKHPHNTAVLRRLNPGMQVIEADLSQPGDWSRALTGARALVMLQAQIGGEDPRAFEANNLRSTERVLEACHRHGIEWIVHVSSSVVNSRAEDDYVRTKRAQEALVEASGIAHVILRPTLMFGWFDRKHLGWLSRFMHRSPLFPIPGHGRYRRQPLYTLDFCRIIAACLRQRPEHSVYDISGLETVDYVELIHALRRACGARTRIVHIPYRLFWLLLKTWALFDRDPPFTTHQLEALVIPETFPVIPWDRIFGVPATPLQRALEQTFQHPQYSKVVLRF